MHTQCAPNFFLPQARHVQESHCVRFFFFRTKFSLSFTFSSHMAVKTLSLFVFFQSRVRLPLPSSSHPNLCQSKQLMCPTLLPPPCSALAPPSCAQLGESGGHTCARSELVYRPPAFCFSFIQRTKQPKSICSIQVTVAMMKCLATRQETQSVNAQGTLLEPRIHHGAS